MEYYPIFFIACEVVEKFCVLYSRFGIPASDTVAVQRGRGLTVGEAKCPTRLGYSLIGVNVYLIVLSRNFLRILRLSRFLSDQTEDGLSLINRNITRIGYKIMKTRIILILLLTVANCVVAQTVSREKEVPLIPTRHQSFAIPFEIRSDDPTNLPKEVELIYSTDQGLNWYPFDRVHPDQKQFDFQSQNDGQYWFIFKTYGSDGIAKQTNRQGPMLKVLVDSIPPKLSVTAEQKGTGEILLTWSVEDANLPENHPRITIAYSDSKNSRTSTDPDSWKPIAVDSSSIHSLGSKHSGDVIWWPLRNAKSVEIRAEIADAAGNKEIHNQTLMLDSHEIAANNDILAEIEPLNLEISEKPHPPKQPIFTPEQNRQSNGDRVSSVPDVRNQNVGKKIATVNTDINRPKPTANSLVPLSPPKPLTISPNITKKETITSKSTVVSQPTGAPAPNSRVLLLSEMNRALATLSPNPVSDETSIKPVEAEAAPMYSGSVSDKSDDLFYLEKPADPATDISESEFPNLLFDDVLLPEPEENTSPSIDDIQTKSNEETQEIDGLFEDIAPVKFEMNPKYGEETVSKPAPELEYESFKFPALDIPNAEEQAADALVPEPQPVVSPTTDEESFDFAGPGIRISKVSLIDGPEGKQVLVKWATDGKSWTALEDTKIHIFRAEKLEGPWIQQAVNLKNEGQHAWTVSQIDSKPFYLFIRCERENNRVYDSTRQAIQIPK